MEGRVRGGRGEEGRERKFLASRPVAWRVDSLLSPYVVNGTSMLKKSHHQQGDPTTFFERSAAVAIPCGCSVGGLIG